MRRFFAIFWPVVASIDFPSRIFFLPCLDYHDFDISSWLLMVFLSRLSPLTQLYWTAEEELTLWSWHFIEHAYSLVNVMLWITKTLQELYSIVIFILHFNDLEIWSQHSSLFCHFPLLFLMKVQFIDSHNSHFYIDNAIPTILLHIFDVYIC